MPGSYPLILSFPTDLRLEVAEIRMATRQNIAVLFRYTRKTCTT